ncbi:putative permease, DMT superfamily [Desulfovibrio ferrophilus]|uniref:Putative permease, DMT superfamily n=2 Tax=Desulfovibrio ferrophilus TaxID=241368 RepID=A0A2Z6B0P6_9BACT|nr:DMT family transporter [Desulfovibrio ferrophilus]BBD09018.1 putative permease, DMT superfamily [Desulfovibrio ferrophilus]
MQSRVVKANIFLLITAMVWGTGFVAQRSGMDYVGPMIFNAVRFAIGSLSLVPLVIWSSRRGTTLPPGTEVSKGFAIRGAMIAGAILFLGVALQQVGLVNTTAAKGGFITGLYVVFVPFLGLIIGQRPGLGGALGAGIAAAGLFLLSVTADFTLAPGDSWVLASAIFWAIHVLVLGWLSPKMDCIKLAFGQFAFCSLLHFIAAFLTEEVTLASLQAGWFPIVYGGIMPVGVAYTLQVIAQKDAPPTHAAVILSLEAVFAALGGWVILGESMTGRGMFGCALMLSGMLVAQLWPKTQGSEETV